MSSDLPQLQPGCSDITTDAPIQTSTVANARPPLRCITRAIRTRTPRRRPIITKPSATISASAPPPALGPLASHDAQPALPVPPWNGVISRTVWLPVSSFANTCSVPVSVIALMSDIAMRPESPVVHSVDGCVAPALPNANWIALPLTMSQPGMTIVSPSHVT